MDRLAEGSPRNCEENGWYVLHSSTQYFRSLFAVIDGMTIHRSLMLLVEHGKTQKYIG